MIELENNLLNEPFSTDQVPKDMYTIFKKVYKNDLIKKHILETEKKLNKFYLLKEFITILDRQTYTEMPRVERTILFNTSNYTDYPSTMWQIEGYNDVLLFLNKRYSTNFRIENFEDFKSNVYDSDGKTIEYLNWASRDSTFVANNIERYFSSNTAIWLGNGIYILCNKNFIVAPESSLNSENTVTKLYVVVAKLAIKNGLTKEYLGTLNRITDPLFSILTEEEKETLSNFLFMKNINRYVEQFNRNASRYVENLKHRQEEAIKVYEDLLKTTLLYNERIISVRSTFEKTIKEAINLIEHYKKLNYIKNVNFNTTSDYFEIMINTKIMPVLYIDEDVLKSSFKANYYDLSTDSKEYNNIKEHLENNNTYFATGPCYVKIGVPINPEKRVTFYFNSNTDLQINGHASFTCLGTFAQPIIDAANEVNIKKVIALIIQYLQSISPHDAGGRRTIANQIILDENNETILYVSSTRYRWLIGKKLNEIKYSETGGIVEDE